MRNAVTCAAFAATAVVSSALLATPAAAAEVLLHQSFETTSGYTLSNQFYDSDDDYFTRVLDPDTSNTAETPEIDVFHASDTYTNVDGEHYLAGEDTDDTGAAGADGLAVKTITFDALDISPYQSLTLTGHFAGGTGLTYDPDDLLYVEASVDGASFVKLLQFASSAATDASPDNEYLAPDSDLDGVGEGPALTSTLTAFSAPLPLGTSLVLRITAEGFNSGHEEFAVDAFTVTGAIPEPSGVAAVGVLALALGRRRRM